jgi:hypothetical protein
VAAGSGRKPADAMGAFEEEEGTPTVMLMAVRRMIGIRFVFAFILFCLFRCFVS